jgi:hypothetical protein
MWNMSRCQGDTFQKKGIGREFIVFGRFQELYALYVKETEWKRK